MIFFDDIRLSYVERTHAEKGTCKVIQRKMYL